MKNQTLSKTEKALNTLKSYVFRGIVTSLVLSSPSVKAADLESLKNLFHQNFKSYIYKDNRSLESTENFVKLALRHEIDLENAYVVVVKNEGSQDWGSVNVLKARGEGAPSDTQNGERLPGEANFSYHSFLIADGYVFDFDFENTPKVLTLKNYVNEMFLPSANKNDIKLMTKKFQNYTAELHSINDNIKKPLTYLETQSFLNFIGL